APTPASDPARWGRWVENACLAFAWNSGQQVRYWREEPLEVDAIVDGSWGKLAIEVKTGAFSAADLRGLLEFTRRNPSYRPLVLCDAGQQAAVRQMGVEALAWGAYLANGVRGSEDVRQRQPRPLMPLAGERGWVRKG
ncbi:MAG: hypothetical protein SFX73_05515, partial [Kofleriaceae bacterium]|nr:hypothetical protein [Kofleriaceae bacterium]